MKPAHLSFLLLVIGLFGLPTASPAAVSSTENGARWLRAELPAKVDFQDADCEQLAGAVGRATLAHQPEAPAILRTALTRGVLRPLRRGEGSKSLLPCAWAKRIFSISVAAAPSQASTLLDVATELYPDCATELAGVMRDYDRISYDYKDSKDRANDKNVVDGRGDDPDATPRGTSKVPSDASDPTSDLPPTFDPGTDIQYRGDLTDRDIAGMDLDNINGFGTGDFRNVGFPGQPGFAGSFPDGSLALPLPLTVAVNG